MSGAALILGIETSCDETAAAVVRDGRQVLSNVIASQHDLHEEYRGVVPEIASRAHVEQIIPVIQRAIAEANCSLADLDAVAIGHRPGLIGSLLVGLSAAKALAFRLGIGFVGVDHVHAHLHAALLDAPPPEFPALGLVVSGGHTSLYDVTSTTLIKRLGATIDDAIGEAYDKVATILELGYPGGPLLDQLAQHGDATAFKLPISRLSKESLDFSFSGLKTATLYAWNGVPNSGAPGARETDDPVAARRDLAASFQKAAIDAVMFKLKRALDRMPDAKCVLVGGGVSANSLLRSRLETMCAKRNLELRLPHMDFCMDNAAMIAGLGHDLLASRNFVSDAWTLGAVPTTAC